MNGFLSVLRKEFKHLRRDPASLVIAMMLPFMQMIIFGYAVNFDVRHIATVVVDLDASPESRQYVEQLRAGEYIDAVHRARSPERAAQMIKDGTAHVAVIIPAGFARTKAAGGKPQVGVMIDGSDAQVSLRARFAFVSPPVALPPGQPDSRVNVLFNPDSKTSNFMIPGLIAVILQIVTVSLTAFSIVREKEQGTLEQLMVSPVGRLALMLGKLIPYACLAFAELWVVLFVSDVVFGVTCRGSVFVLAAMSIPFIVASLGVGL
ncbi:MAG: ABC transporter permease, partial [Thaumarchaeota archaeon]|nr:ABC transporter permease [Nitrososphaerota archaeon]